MTYPRYRNGYVDDGSLIKARNRHNKCPNCGSSNYRETVSKEECSSCGLVCDYWGNGTNGVYESYLARRDAENAERERRRQEELDREWNQSREEESDW